MLSDGITYLNINLKDNIKIKNIKTNEYIENKLQLRYYEKDAITGKFYSDIKFDNAEDYLIIANDKEECLLSDKLGYSKLPYYAIISTPSNKITRLEKFFISPSDGFYSVLLDNRVASLIKDHLSDIKIKDDFEIKLKYLATVEFKTLKGSELLFYLTTNNDELKEKINKLKLVLLKEHIEKMTKQIIEYGLVFNLRNTLIHFRLRKLDVENLNNPEVHLDNFSVINDEKLYIFKKFEYDRLKHEINLMENYYALYAECLYDYLEKNIESFDLDEDYIFYGYLNSEIIHNIKLKARERNLYEILEQW